MENERMAEIEKMSLDELYDEQEGILEWMAEGKGQVSREQYNRWKEDLKLVEALISEKEL